VPMAELDSEQLLRMAQVIYTALLKVYLVARPVLVGSLCRIENWCDVEEVEGLLKAQMVSIGGVQRVAAKQKVDDRTESWGSDRSVPGQEDARQGSEDASRVGGPLFWEGCSQAYSNNTDWRRWRPTGWIDIPQRFATSRSSDRARST
jgi:hypothetical protein